MSYAAEYNEIQRKAAKEIKGCLLDAKTLPPNYSLMNYNDDSGEDQIYSAIQK
jgi:hypothetical protein